VTVVVKTVHQLLQWCVNLTSRRLPEHATSGKPPDYMGSVTSHRYTILCIQIYKKQDGKQELQARALTFLMEEKK